MQPITPSHESGANLYDVVEYPGQSHEQTHPERLATIGILYGLNPAPPTRCRVLELGCGSAGNIAPLAWALPESRFTGLDLAAKPIQQGRELAGHLNLKNLKLVQANLLAVDRSLGEFDYIIAHGVYAWVPEEVRDHLLAICRQCLAPQGIAFISYNAFPGAQMSVMLREMMLFHAGQIADPNERTRQAMALMNLVAKALPSGHDARSEWVQIELKRILEAAPAQLFHDELAPVYAPVSFTEFMQHAARHELRFVAEADFREMSDRLFSNEAQQALAQLATDQIRHEQYRDFLKLRRFRQTLLTHRENTVRNEPDNRRVTDLIATLRSSLTAGNTNLAAGAATTFTARPSGRVETDFPPGKAALHYMMRSHPAAVPVAELFSACQQMLADAGVVLHDSEDAQSQLSEFMLQLFERGLVQLHTWFPAIPRKPGDRPMASPIARWQIEREPRITTLTHRSVEVQDAVGRSLLKLLDGTRDRPALCDAIMVELQKQGLIKGEPASIDQVRADVADRLETNLQMLADLTLLIR